MSLVNNSQQAPASSRLSVIITYPFTIGGASGGARMTREIARNLVKLGAAVTVLPVMANGRTHYPRPELSDTALGVEEAKKLKRDGVEVIMVPPHPRHWWLDGLPVKKAISSILETRQVDIVLSYYNDGAFLSRFLRKRKIKFGYIATWQSYKMALSKFVPRGGIARKIIERQRDYWTVIRPYRQADIIFATSNFTRDELIELVNVDADRISVCYLGVDTRFSNIQRRPSAKINRFIFFGRIVQSKGILDALQALGKLNEKGFTDWTFHILGPGKHSWAKKKALENGIAEQVTVRGPIDDDELRHELELAQVAIMPSHAESFGLSNAEAQAAGLPVVAYSAGSVPEVLDNGCTAWLAPTGEVDQLMACIEESIHDPEKTHQAGMAGRERVIKLFTWKKTATTILDGALAICKPGG